LPIVKSQEFVYCEAVPAGFVRCHRAKPSMEDPKIGRVGPFAINFHGRFYYNIRERILTVLEGLIANL